ncbi:hypothetical protein V1264_009639 [Littorina saxatilis]|uniref:G-protein coupled receptors family 1 profile domain-containing protein n=2 Tax=Littorina saxatilis TaxID=31220 RepID=A0AAN9G2Y4_9CAEN
MLHIEWTSAVSGYVDNSCQDHPDACGKNASYHLTLPKNHVAMVSVPVFSFKENQHLNLYAVTEDGELARLWTTSGTALKVIPAQIVNTSIFVELVSEREYRQSEGFQMLFSFHPVSNYPQRNGDGLFNCSSPDYASFRQHLDCNSLVECLGSQDARHCPEFERELHKDYQMFPRERTRGTVLTWYDGQESCRQLGGDLAMMKTLAEWNKFYQVVGNVSRSVGNFVWVGIHGYDLNVADYYRHAYFWADNTVSYSVNLTHLFYRTVQGRVCLYHSPGCNRHLCYADCKIRYATAYACQFERRNSSAEPRRAVDFSELRNLTRKTTNQSLVRCENGGHMTHSFLSCDPQSHCGTRQLYSDCSISIPHVSGASVPRKNNADLAEDDARYNISGSNSDASFTAGDVRVAMFVCEDGRSTVPYSLVCDFREDCDDASDEAWCVHSEQCVGFTCRNGQCVAETAYCDVRRDCWDGSDELCDHAHLLTRTIVRMLPPTLISFDGQGNFSQTLLSPSDLCPETHLRCSDGNCLPVFVRCNGVYDCIDKADEAHCDNVTCPGFYRCRSSSVCVHPDHLCDGWPQCPQRDDEWLCQALCPSRCSCHGHAFVCPRPFPAPSFPQLRYLDALGSGMTMNDVSSNVYLIWLRLASCGIVELQVMDLRNLRMLDLSDNQLTTLRMDAFLNLTNLAVLCLAGNPLLSVTAGNNYTQQQTLRVLDLSSTFLTSFGSLAFSGFPELRTLNASNSKIEVITEDGFVHTPKLGLVDLQGNPVERFPVNLFTGLLRLEAVYSDNYKLCCSDTLPANFEIDSCHAPRDEISSCEDLLRSDVFRAFLWMFCSLACFGNAGCLLFRSFVQKASMSSGFNVFVSSLGAADFLMGIYLAMVGGADIAYQGQYSLFETAWKSGVVCKAAGFLSLLSCEISATMICVITLDRFLVLRFPFSRFHFEPKSAVLACVAVWLLGVIIAVVPLLPVTSQWQFYGQTGICIPLPITRQSFPGQDYAFAVMIVLNLVLFLLIAAGQLLIFWTIRDTAITSTARYKSQEMTVARRLTSIVVSDFLCWFPIGLLGVLAATGTPIPGEVNVAVAILVLPLNSALNPFLYTFNLLVERLDRQEEQRLLKQLEEERDQDRPAGGEVGQASGAEASQPAGGGARPRLRPAGGEVGQASGAEASQAAGGGLRPAGGEVGQASGAEASQAAGGGARPRLSTVEPPF